MAQRKATIMYCYSPTAAAATINGMMTTLPNIIIFLQTFNDFIHQSTCVLSRFRSVHLFATPWTVVHQAPLLMRFSK